MFTWAIIAIETVTAVALVFLVLLHSGQGGRDLGPDGWFHRCGGDGFDRRGKEPRRITIAVALVFTFATLALDLRLQ